jgi:ATP-binding cassette subfamily B protein
VIFVTHRVSTAALADQIVVMENGTVAAVGTHADLSRDCEPYRAMLGGDTPDDGRRLRAVAPVVR